MKWRTATMGQLYEIAYHDQECSPRHKLEAAEELRRRREKAATKKQMQVKIRRKRA